MSSVVLHSGSGSNASFSPSPMTAWMTPGFVAALMPAANPVSQYFSDWKYSSPPLLPYRSTAEFEPPS